MPDHVDVILSSTSNDLKAYRQPVIDVILSMDLHPIAMENFNPSAEKTLQYCYDKVQEAEIFVGIYAYRYGYIPDPGVPYAQTVTDGS